MDKVIIDKIDVSGCEHYRAEIETKMPYGEYEIQKDKCHYSGIEIIQNCKGNKGCIYKQLKRLEQENERLKEEKSKLLSKCLDKQCRINELQQICAIKEFSLKVNGKEYKNLSGIDKAKLFINSENAVRDRYIQKLENKMSDLQCKFYENCKEVVDAQKQIDKYSQALQEIREIVDCAKCEYESNDNCNPQQCSKIETKINEVIGAE